LSEPTFSIGGTDYTVTSIRWGAAGENHIHLTLDRPLADEDLASLVLQIDDAGLSLAEAGVNEPSDHGFTANYTWDGDGSPDEGSTISVRLTRGPFKRERGRDRRPNRVSPGRMCRVIAATHPHRESQG
jgi:hypothetical protein